jgi:hypothetical protein
MDWIPQVGIFLTGISSIWLISRKEKWMRWGYILGLCGQPFWFWSSIIHKQWGILFLAVWYTYAWCQGIYNYWIKKEEKSG